MARVFFSSSLALSHRLIYNRDLVHENETPLRYKTPLSISHTHPPMSFESLLDNLVSPGNFFMMA